MQRSENIIVYEDGEFQYATTNGPSPLITIGEHQQIGLLQIRL